MKDINEQKFISIQSKVSVQTAKRIDWIVKKYKFDSRYELVQYILSAFLKIADPEGEADNESTELLEFAKVFEGFENRKTRIITTKPSGNRALKLTDSINIYSELGRKGYVCRKISIDGDDIHTSCSNEKALSTLLKKLHPALFIKLIDIGREIEEVSVQKILSFLIAESTTVGQQIDDRYILDTFDKASGGTEYGNTPKRMKNKSVYNE